MTTNLSSLEVYTNLLLRHRNRLVQLVEELSSRHLEDSEEVRGSTVEGVDGDYGCVGMEQAKKLHLTETNQEEYLRSDPDLL